MAMKFLIWATLVTLTLGCSSVPEQVKDDGREAAERAKQKAEDAYRDLEKEM